MVGDVTGEGVDSSGVELGAVDLCSSCVETGAGEELDAMTSGAVSTVLLDEAGAEETTGLSSGVGVEEDDVGGSSGVPVPSGGCEISGVLVTVIA